VYLLVLGIVLLLSVQRLSALGLFGSPRALWAPFARPLLGVAFEITLQVGLPAALLGARALGLALREIALAAALLISLSWIAASRMDAGALAPGHLVQELLDRGRSSCFETNARRVEVPLVRATWTCAKNKKPVLLAGAGFGEGTQLSAGSVRVSSDLRRLEVEQLAVELPALPKRLGLRLRADHAKIRGLPPWGRPADSPASQRLALSSAAAGLTLIAGLLAQARLKVGFWVSVGMGVAAGASLVGAQRLLDRYGAGFSGYALAVLAGPTCIAVLFGVAFVPGLARTLARRLFQR
jgi:hypothetical protein